MASRTHRRAGAGAVAGGALGLLLLPLVTSAYGAASSGPATDPAWGPVLRGSLEPLFGFADADRVHATYGLVYLLVVAGLLVALLALRRDRAAQQSGAERWGFRLLFAGLVLHLLGLLTDYTVFDGTVVENLGFALGSLLGLLLLVTGGLLVGVPWLRDPGGPRLAGALLTVAVPGMFLLGLLGFGNLPSMPLAWFGLAGIPLGLFLLRGAGRSVAVPR